MRMRARCVGERILRVDLLSLPTPKAIKREKLKGTSRSLNPRPCLGGSKVKPLGHHNLWVNHSKVPTYDIIDVYPVKWGGNGFFTTKIKAQYPITLKHFDGLFVNKSAVRKLGNSVYSCSRHKLPAWEWAGRQMLANYRLRTR